MADDSQQRVTRILHDLTGGDRSAVESLLPLVYDDLRALAASSLRQERANHTLQPTALAHEVYLRMVDQTRTTWRDRNHFFAIAAQAMRRVLVDHARGKGRAKRGGDRVRVELSEAVAVTPERDVDVLALNEAMERLQALDERQSRVVELRFFAGLTMDEVADALGVSKRTAEGDWTMARAWLKRELQRGDGTDDTQPPEPEHTPGPSQGETAT